MATIMHCCSCKRGPDRDGRRGDGGAAAALGVVVGNEAVWTTEPDDGPPALLGMDLVRLAAERGATAAAAVDALVELLESHGQGGGCAEGDDWSYHNSFMVADAGEAWVVETAGRWWAAERVAGLRNISNCLSVRRWARGAEGLGAACAARGAPARDFAAAFAEGGVPPAGEKSARREAAGAALLEAAAAAAPGALGVGAMAAILRDEGSGICMRGAFRTNGAMISVLRSDGECVHYLTGTPDPTRGAFKAFRLPPPGADADVWAAAQCALTAAPPARRNPTTPLWAAAARGWAAAAARPAAARPLRAALAAVEAESLAGALPFGEAAARELAAYERAAAA
jgi:secernin